MKKVLLLCDEIPKHHGVQLTHALHLFFHIFSTIANEDIQSIVRQKIYLQAILCHLIEGQIYKIQYVLRVKTISSFDSQTKHTFFSPFSTLGKYRMCNYNV